MDHKLTLRLNNQVIEKAKIYARKKNTSPSKLIEAYLQFLTSNTAVETGEKVTPLVKSLSGVLDSGKVGDAGQSYKKHLNRKYSK